MSKPEPRSGLAQRATIHARASRCQFRSIDDFHEDGKCRLGLFGKLLWHPLCQLSMVAGGFPVGG
jgi:hypothetical protein